jgi:hypothetical protein
VCYARLHPNALDQNPRSAGHFNSQHIPNWRAVSHQGQLPSPSGCVSVRSGVLDLGPDPGLHAESTDPVWDIPNIGPKCAYMRVCPLMFKDQPRQRGWRHRWWRREATKVCARFDFDEVLSRTSGWMPTTLRENSHRESHVLAAKTPACSGARDFP